MRNNSIRLRPYKPCDGKEVVKWISDEFAYRQWCADILPSFPLSEEELNKHYDTFKNADNYWPMTAFNDSGVIGHFIMRFTDDEKKTVRLGFVIVDKSLRGQGYGKEMLKLAIDFSFNILKVDKITLGVFENNTSAFYCYKSVGFKELKEDKEEFYSIMGEKWKCIEMEIEREL